MTTSNSSSSADSSSAAPSVNMFKPPPQITQNTTNAFARNKEIKQPITINQTVIAKNDSFFIDSLSSVKQQQNTNLKTPQHQDILAQYRLNSSSINNVNDDYDEDDDGINDNQHSSPNLNEYDAYDLDEEDEEEEEIDTGGELLFSDHAHLYEPLESLNGQNEEEDEYDDEKSLNASQRQLNSNKKINSTRSRLNNYDIFKLTKKNYKLTYDQPNYPIVNGVGPLPSNLVMNNAVMITSHENDMMMMMMAEGQANMNQYSNRNQFNNNNNNENSDSFASSMLLQQSSNYDENNLTNEFAEYEQEECRDDDDEEEMLQQRQQTNETDDYEMNDEDGDECEKIVKHGFRQKNFNCK